MAFAATSPKITTINVADLTPNSAKAGATNVPIVTFTLDSNRVGGDTFNTAKMKYSGTSTTDIAKVYLYTESSGSGGTFDASTDISCGSDTAPSSSEYSISPSSSCDLSENIAKQFYIVVDVKASPTNGNTIDININLNKLTFQSGTWPNATDLALFDPAGSTTIDTVKPAITLNGSTPITIEVGSVYSDASATASDNFDGDITGNIVTVNPINANVLGTYTITYDVNDAAGNTATQVTRTVNVVDTTAPVITLTGSSPFTVEVGSTYTDEGATASDNYDGNITANIATVNPVNANVLGTYTITYDVNDAAGNTATQVTRTVNVVDTTKPVITLTGANPQTIEVGTPYIELGATATDNYDANAQITSNIAIDANAVDTNMVGSYDVNYNVADSQGNSAVTVTRAVNVVDTTIPEISLVGGNPQTIEVGSDYTELGATASDNYDGNITASIEIDSSEVDTSTIDSYIVTYDVTDSSGNAAVQVTRDVNVVDTTAPVTTATAENDYNFGTWTNDENVTIDLACDDGSGSGCATIKYCTDDGTNACDALNGTLYSSPLAIIDKGITYVRFASIDNAGNQETTANGKTVKIADANQLVADANNVTVNADQNEVIIQAGSPVQEIDVPSSVPSDSNVFINVSALLDSNNSVTLSNDLTLRRDTVDYNYVVVIPAGTTITGDANWNGQISVPTVNDNSTVTVTPDSGKTASTTIVVEIGFGDIKLVFDKGVRILISSQAGKFIGYSRNGTFTAIATACAADDQATGDALAAEGDCKIDAGLDLAIWTKHFTQFVTYNQTPVPATQTSNNGGSGGVGGSGALLTTTSSGTSTTQETPTAPTPTQPTPQPTPRRTTTATQPTVEQPATTEQPAAVEPTQPTTPTGFFGLGGGENIAIGLVAILLIVAIVARFNGGTALAKLVGKKQ